jgi:Zn ribbon nucleic-acid-binding protein
MSDCPACGAADTLVASTFGDTCVRCGHKPGDVPLAVQIERRKAKRRRDRQAKRRANCRHLRWTPGVFQTINNERRKISACGSCGELRQVEA